MNAVSDKNFVDQINKTCRNLPSGQSNNRQLSKYISGEYREQKDLEQIHIAVAFRTCNTHHNDIYPLDILQTILGGNSQNAVPLEIDSLDTRRGDTEYMYYIWQAPLKTTWISIFELHQYHAYEDECIFVGEASKLIKKYKQNTNYDG